MALDAKTRHWRLEGRRRRRRARRSERTVEQIAATRAFKGRVRDRGAAAQITFLEAIGDHVRARAKQVWTVRQERRLERFEWRQRPLSHRHLVLHPVLYPETGLYVNVWRPAAEVRPDGEKKRRGFSLGKRQEKG